MIVRLESLSEWSDLHKLTHVPWHRIVLDANDDRFPGTGFDLPVQLVDHVLLDRPLTGGPIRLQSASSDRPRILVIQLIQNPMSLQQYAS